MGLVIGLTGGIGSGKTTVAHLFADHGITIVDADIIAREVVEPGTPALAAIIDHFGIELYDQQGQLNRSELRHRIFENPEEKQWLEDLLHPLIRKALLEALENSTSIYTLLVAPLLLENGLDHYIDRLLVVDVPESIQIERTMLRDHATEQHVQAILNSQISREQRLASADFVIDNTEPMDQLTLAIDNLDQQFRELAAMDES